MRPLFLMRQIEYRNRSFKDYLRRILELLPEQRQTGLLSLSASDAVGQIFRVNLRNPVKIVCTCTISRERMEFVSIEYKPSNKSFNHFRVIHHLPVHLRCNRNFQLVPLALLPSREGQSWLIPRLHDKNPAKLREKNFTAFTNAVSTSILLTEDVAAKGLDIARADLAIQLDPSTNPNVFRHRYRRAGQLRRKGLSVLFFTT